MEKEYSKAVFIGRFQPFHKGHLKILKQGEEIADEVVIIIGSTHSAPNIKNPWSFEERKKMIISCFPEVEQNMLKANLHPTIKIEGVRDYFYNEHFWITDVRAKVGKYAKSGESVALIGNFKDESSYYLSHFPEWDLTPIKGPDINSTDIREKLFDINLATDWEDKIIKPVPPKILEKVPPTVKDRVALYMQTKAYADRVVEYSFVKAYRAAYSGLPYPPIFSTVDTIVVCQGHILLVRRKHHPGQGLLAIPGGFVKADERLEIAAMRELKEESQIRIDKNDIMNCISRTHVFDHPGRSRRGRTITHAYYINLTNWHKLPEVTASSDASEVFWMPILDLSKHEQEFFEDHFHIINHFIQGDA